MQEKVIAIIATKVNLELENKTFGLHNRREQVKQTYSVNCQKREIDNKYADQWDN
jgi:hypothetical protein